MIKGNYNGWSSYSFEKNKLKIVVCPELGGRIMEFSLGGFNFLFVNPNLLGEKNIQPTSLWNKEWQNFGGDKVWIAPQGWSGQGEWAGPPDPVLDGGYYDSEILTPASIRLISPIDTCTGIRILREVRLDSDGVTIKATFRNAGDETVRWSIWPVIQVGGCSVYDDNYQIIIPKNDKSVFEQGYKVIHGLVNNPQFSVENKNIVVNYKYIVGKIGIDSDVGWVAFCDRSCGKVLVVEYDYQSEAEYPDQNPVQIWTQGRGVFYSRNSIRELADDPVKNPGYSEIELLSPLQDIEPDAEIDFTYRMKACTIPTGMSVINTSKCAVTAKELSIGVKDESVHVSACYGFFQEGVVHLVLRCDDEKKVLTEDMNVTPVTALNLNLEIDLEIKQHAQAIYIEYMDAGGNLFIIDKKTICKN